MYNVKSLLTSYTKVLCMDYHYKPYTIRVYSKPIFAMYTIKE